jgi:hypothetical protein
MKPLKNYENLYYITDDLKIFSVARKGTSGNKIIPQMNTENGYLRVGLSKDNKRKKVMLHRIIAENFIPNPNNYTTVDHINGNKLDNTIDNLRWCSQAENTRFDNHKIRSNNTSGFRGISFDKRCSKYQAEISFDGKRIYVGKFDTLEMAIQERNKHIMYHNG